MHTIAQHKKRPFTQNLDLTGVECKKFATNLCEFMEWLKKENKAHASPEQEAIWFYLMNHAMANVALKYDADEPISQEVHDLIMHYHRNVQIKALRMAFYLVLICTRESRHAHTNNNLTELYSKYPSSVKEFHKQLSELGSDGAAKKFKVNPPPVTMGVYSSFLEDVFFKCNYGGGYGGKAWGQIAKILRQFIHGEISPEMMLDTAFTLCHNNGPIFNKGMLYDMYDGGAIVKILDVQRSGQIPQLVASKESPHVTHEHKEYQAHVQKIVGDFNGYVDWYVVEALGSVKKYPSEKQNQIAKYGKSDKTQKLEEEAKKTAEKKEAQKILAAQKMKELFEKTKFEVMPGLVVDKIKMERK
jgi:hypothetical protein